MWRPGLKCVVDEGGEDEAMRLPRCPAGCAASTPAIHRSSNAASSGVVDHGDGSTEMAHVGDRHRGDSRPDQITVDSLLMPRAPILTSPAEQADSAYNQLSGGFCRGEA